MTAALTAPAVAWHNDPALKAATVARMRAHREEDEFTRGAYTELTDIGWRGCFHGCLTTEAIAAERGHSVRQTAEVLHLHGSMWWHAEAERLFGIHARVGLLLDDMFESVDEADAGAFAVDVTEAIPVGADLSRVPALFVLDLLTDPEYGAVVLYENGTPERAALDAVAALWRREAAGDPQTREEWLDAEQLVEELGYPDVIDAVSRLNCEFQPVILEAARSVTHGEADRDAHIRWQTARLIEHIANAPQAQAAHHD